MYMAIIIFQKKACHLGFYKRIAEAVEARKDAEEPLLTVLPDVTKSGKLVRKNIRNGEE